MHKNGEPNSFESSLARTTRPEVSTAVDGRYEDCQEGWTQSIPKASKSGTDGVVQLLLW